MTQLLNSSTIILKTLMSIKMNTNTKTALFLTGYKASFFESLQNSLVPRSKDFTPLQKQQSKDLINRLLDDQSESSKRKLALFFILIDLFSVLTNGKTFIKLKDDNKKALLQSFFDSPISLLRKGFWGINTLARMGVYGQTELHAEIGYTLRSNTHE